METVTDSPDWQISLPRGASESPGLTPSQQVRAVVRDGRIELTPVHTITRVRGFLARIDTTVEREKGRE